MGSDEVKTIDAVESPLAGVICDKGIYEAVFTDSPVGVCLTDVTGRFLDANETCAELLGYSRSEMIGMTFQHITHPEDIPYDTQMLNKILHGDVSHYGMLKRFIDKMGRIVWVNVHMRVVRDAKGSPAYFIKHIEPQNGSRWNIIGQMKVGEVFSHPRMRMFVRVAIGLLVYNTLISTICLLHILGMLLPH